MIRTLVAGLAIVGSASALAQAQADPIVVTPVTLESKCPGPHSSAGFTGVIPHLSTLADATGAPFNATLYYKDGYGPLQHFTLTLCAFTPAGVFMGGSTIGYRGGSRLWFDQNSGVEGHSLTELLQMKPGELDFREFQLYVAAADFSILEYGLLGNNRQVQVFERAPRSHVIGVSYPNAGWVDGVDSVFYISQTSVNAAPACKVAVKLLNDEGTAVLSQYETQIPPRGVARVDVGKFVAPGVSGALEIKAVTGQCGEIFVSRETEYPSDALGGKGFFMEMRQ